MHIHFYLGLRQAVLWAYFLDDALDILKVVIKGLPIHPRLQLLSKNLLAFYGVNLQIVRIVILKINLAIWRAMIQSLLKLGIDLHPDNQILLYHPN